MKKRALTLLEVIIVIFLITLITGAIGYNMKGTLDRGRAFRTEQAINELHDLLLVCVAEGHSFRDVRDHAPARIQECGLAKSPEKLMLDGWGNALEITLSPEKDDFIIRSPSLESYNKKIGKNQ